VSSPSTNQCKPLVDASCWRADADALRAFAEAQGYLFVKALLEPDRIAVVRRIVRAECARLGWVTASGTPLCAAPGARLSGQGHDDPHWLSLQQTLMIRREIQRLAEHRHILATLAAIYAEPPQRHRGDVFRIGLPHSSDLTTPPHQDLYYVNRPVALWTVWIPLVECPLDTGPLAVVPKSHRDGVRAHVEVGRPGIEMPDDTEWAASPLEPGDVLMFSGLTVHAALPNTTEDRVRLSLDYRYLPASTPLFAG
jgi:ectoine hydroxylase-related dioxygenase (phytanoyl-CoA dioxygenase family)